MEGGAAPASFPPKGAGAEISTHKSERFSHSKNAAFYMTDTGSKARNGRHGNQHQLAKLGLVSSARASRRNSRAARNQAKAKLLPSRDAVYGGSGGSGASHVNAADGFGLAYMNGMVATYSTPAYPSDHSNYCIMNTHHYNGFVADYPPNGVSVHEHARNGHSGDVINGYAALEHHGNGNNVDHFHHNGFLQDSGHDHHHPPHVDCASGIGGPADVISDGIEPERQFVPSMAPPHLGAEHVVVEPPPQQLIPPELLGYIGEWTNRHSSLFA